MRVLSRRAALATTLSVTTGVIAMSQAADAQPVTTTPSGLKIIDIKVGRLRHRYDSSCYYGKGGGECGAAR
jgi:hypothetical protein